MCSYMVVCALYPRFELLAALGDRRALISEPAALAPEAGREQVVGEVSAPAEAFGVRLPASSNEMLPVLTAVVFGTPSQFVSATPALKFGLPVALTAAARPVNGLAALLKMMPCGGVAEPPAAPRKMDG